MFSFKMLKALTYPIFLIKWIKNVQKTHILAVIHRNVHKTQIAIFFFFLNGVSPSDV